jgi:excisionase family DNA binding protein
VSLFDETALRDIIRDEVRTAIRQELGKKPVTAGDYVSVVEAANIASVQGQTIRAWIRSGRLTEYKAGRVLRVRRSELETFLAAAPRPATASDLSPEDLADMRFRERQAAACDRRSRVHGRPPGETP